MAACQASSRSSYLVKQMNRHVFYPLIMSEYVAVNYMRAVTYGRVFVLVFSHVHATL